MDTRTPCCQSFGEKTGVKEGKVDAIRAGGERSPTGWLH